MIQFPLNSMLLKSSKNISCKFIYIHNPTELYNPVIHVFNKDMILLIFMTPQKIFAIIEDHIPAFKGKKMSIKPLKGLTNLTYQVIIQNENESIVFRKFCGDVDRKLQNKTYQLLFEKGVAPKCYYANEEYRIEQFITEGVHPALQLYSNQQIVQPMIQKMSEFHTIQPYQYNKNNQFPQLLKQVFNQALLEKMFVTEPNSNIQQQQQKNFVLLVTKLQVFLKQKKSRQMLWQKLAVDAKTIRFCHNDLNNLNMFLIKKHEKYQFKFIDFEYAAYNYIAYDIANLLNQSTIDYSKKQYPGFQVIRKVTMDQVKIIAGFYPEKYDGLQEDVYKCLCLCNLYWACWSVLMATENPNDIFGVCAHGLMRLQMFQLYYKDILNK